jgi:hypothetical protein
MMSLYTLIDVVPDPERSAGVGIAAMVILFVIGSVMLLSAGLVLFLWLRKRRMRHVEMVHRADSAIYAGRSGS